MKQFLMKLFGVLIVAGITYGLCGVYAGNWSILTWDLSVKLVFIVIVAIIAFVNLLGD